MKQEISNPYSGTLGGQAGLVDVVDHHFNPQVDATNLQSRDVLFVVSPKPIQIHFSPQSKALWIRRTTPPL